MSLYTYLQNEYKLDSWYRYYPPTFIINNVNQQDLDKYIEEKLQEKMPDLSKDFVDNIINYVNTIIEEKIAQQDNNEEEIPSEPEPDPEQPPEEDPSSSEEEPAAADTDFTISVTKTDGAVNLTLEGDLTPLQHFHWLVIFDYTIQEFITNEPKLKLDNLYNHMYNMAEKVKVIIHINKKSKEFIIK